MKKRILVLGLLVMFLLFFGQIIFAEGAQEQQKEVVIRYAHTNSPNSTAGLSAQKFADLVKEKTGETVKIEVYPSAQLGVLDEMIQGVSLGSIGMGHNDFAALAILHDDLSLFNLPYIYNSSEDALYVTGPESPVIKKVNEELIDNSNVRILFSFYYGTRHLSCNSPIYTPEDLKGKKIRAIPVKVWIETIKGMGAIPTGVDFSELPTALATNVVDGQENPLDTIWSNKLHEFQDYIMLTGHMIATLPVYINNSTWNKLNEQQKEAILSAGQEVADWSLQYAKQREKELIPQFEETGVTVISEEDGLKVEAFRSRVQDHIQSVFTEWGDYLDDIKELQ